MNPLEEALLDSPETARLIGPSRSAMKGLLRSWKRGATRAEQHPLVALLLSEPSTGRRAMLEEGLAALALSEVELLPFRRRVNCELPVRVSPRRAEKDCTAALTELYLAGRFANAGFNPALIPDTHPGRTPDIEVSVGETPLTLEIQSVFPDDQIELDADARTEAFHAWNPSKDPTPEALRGSVWSRSNGAGTLKMMEGTVSPLGVGPIEDMVRRLANRKHPYGQLQGRPNPVLVLSFWHVWGVGVRDCSQRLKTPKGNQHSTGLLYAAAVGEKEDPLYEAHIEGLSLPPSRQIVAGHLVRTNPLAGVLYLFYDGGAALFVNERPGAPTLDVDSRAAMQQALGLSLTAHETERWSLLTGAAKAVEPASDRP